MIPLRLVLDTNVVVSAALKPDGLQRTVVTLALTKPARLHISPDILHEYQFVLLRSAIKIPKGTRRQMLDLIEKRAHLVAPVHQLRVTTDPSDNIFLECAEAARADYLVTGNLRHFPTFWKTTKIITARQLITLAVPHLLP